MPVTEIVFVAAKRTPFGSFGGSLAGLTATDLGVLAAQGALKAGGVDPKEIDSVCFGNVVQSSSDAIYIARHIALRVGVPVDRPALIVNRLCGSGFESIAQGAYEIFTGQSETVLVGGSESMSQVPYVLRSARFGSRLGHGTVEDYLTASLTDSYTGLPMAITAENLAVTYKISREDADAYALQSQQRAALAWKSGLMEKEIESVVVKTRKGEQKITQDEHMRPDSSLEALAKLPALFKKEGTVTAGNASGMVDGACALIMCTEKKALAKGWPVLGRLEAFASAGCDPKVMGIGPVPATHKALKFYSERAGTSKSIGDFKFVEVNEAFAPQYLAVQKELGLDPAKSNVDGGAIAIGHPLAASGTRLVAHLLYKLQADADKKATALASACIGGGQGMSVIISKV